VTQFVGQDDGPVFTQGLAGVAVAVPGGAHRDLSGAVADGVGGGVVVGVEGVGKDDASLGSEGSQPVVGLDDDVAVGPLVGVLEEVDVAEGNLAVAKVVEMFGSSLQVELELVQVSGVVVGVPLQGDVQVEEDERIVGGDGEGLHA